MTDNPNADLRWWQRGIVYQIYPRSFKDANGDGVGDLAGVIEKLGYLHNLGVDAIWLSPFYPSPMADFGYDVSDYCNVHPLFGDLDTFDRLVAAAHAQGLRVIIDYVPNHTSDQHPWFLESRSSRANPKRNWYLWANPRPDGSRPNNWGSMFGGPAWEWDAATGQYYFHHFLKEQPDLNWRNPEVRQAMHDVLRFWLQRGVDGFRMDVVGMILKDPEWRDNPVNPNAPGDLPENDLVGRQHNVYNQDLDEVQEIIRDFRRLLDGSGDTLAIGEVWNELPRWIRYYGEGGDGLHLPFNFRLIQLPWNAQAVRASVDELDRALPGFAWPNYVLGNHDVQRLASRIGEAQARVAAMLLLTLRGTPTLYYGDELGLHNGIIPPDQIQDPQGRQFGPARNRDISRTPMQWDASPQAGFTTGKPWLPVSGDYASRNLACMSQDPQSILTLYRQLITLRRATPALHGGAYSPMDVSNPDLFVYRRTHSSGDYLIALNFTGRFWATRVTGSGLGQVVLSTSLDREEAVTLEDLRLRPHEGVIIRL